MCKCNLFTHGAPRSSQNSFRNVRAFKDRIGIWEIFGFWGEGKTGVPGEKPLGAEKRTNNKLNLHMTPGPWIEPGTHWWEASALTTAPSLLPAGASLLPDSRHGNQLNPSRGIAQINEELKRTEFYGPFCKKFKLLVDRFSSFFC